MHIFLECEYSLWYGCVHYNRTVGYCPVLHRKVCALFFLSATLLGTLGCKAGRVTPSCTRWYALSKLEGRKEGKEEGGEGGEEGGGGGGRRGEEEGGDEEGGEEKGEE